MTEVVVEALGVNVRAANRARPNYLPMLNVLRQVMAQWGGSRATQTTLLRKPIMQFKIGKFGTRMYDEEANAILCLAQRSPKILSLI